MQRPLLLRGARQLLTLRGTDGPRRGAACLDLGIVTDGSILIRDGRIHSVGHSRRIENLAEARHAVVCEVHGSVIMPAFVDACLAAPDSAADLRRLLHLAFRHGTGALAARLAGASPRPFPHVDRTPAVTVPVIDVATGFDEAVLARLARRLPGGMLRVEPSSHPTTELQRLQSLGLPIRAFSGAQFSSDWVGFAIAYGASSIELPASIAGAHLGLLADAPAFAIARPSSARVIRTLLDAGAALALGSGFGEPYGETCSMQTAMLLASRQGNLDLAEAITLATINAAIALGAGAQRGSLETGKIADLLVLEISDYRDLSSYYGVNVVSQIYQAGNLVS
jgi:imidazolonepropionase-like amidohydrolase